jgi:hypothetical protein
MKKAMAALIILASMTACTAQTTVYKETIDSAGKAILQPVTVVGDTSVARDAQLHETLQNRDRQYANAYKQSGMKLSWNIVTLENGNQMVLPDIEFKESPRFEQPLPTKAADHPVWAFANNMAEKTLWGWLGHGFFDFGKEAIKGAGDTYGGDFAPIQSMNTADFAGAGDGAVFQPFEVRPEVVEPAIVEPQVIFGRPALPVEEVAK